LFHEQLEKLVERGDVAIRKPTEPLQGCECTHEHLAMDNIYPPRNNYLTLNAVRWLLGYSTLVKTILGVM